MRRFALAAGLAASVLLAAACDVSSSGASVDHSTSAAMTPVATSAAPPSQAPPIFTSVGASGSLLASVSPSPSFQPAQATPLPATPSATARAAPPPTKPGPTRPAQPEPAQPKPSSPKPAAPQLLVEELKDVGSASQVVTVTSSGWTTDVATLQTFEKDAAGTWHAVFPAMPAFIGRAGFSADKREGDLKTPAGKYGFGTMFGQQPNPGVKFPYRQADSQSVWVDDVTSPYYNTWQENAALKGEHLASSGYATAYAYAVDIAYNTSPIVKGKGSAIFLHVSTGGGTAGCVSLARSNLLEVLRWLDPNKHPVIVMGPSSVIQQY